MEYRSSVSIYLSFLMIFLESCTCHEENCDYLDTSQSDNINYLHCHSNGCCGSFKDRHCCIGPVVIVASVFGALIGILIIVIVVGYCYTKYYRQGDKKAIVSPEIHITSSGFYDDVPLPSPLTYAPPVHSPHRLHPPLHTLAPFRELSNIDRNPPPVFTHAGRLK